jgi:transcriptional regulator with XRE-family HTH domain
VQRLDSVSNILDSASNVKEALSIGLNERIALRVRDLRAARGLSLDALARRCGVSRSMISLIERGRTSPTAVVLDKLAAGLDVSTASLFDDPQPRSGAVARGADQQPWRDPGSGYVRRNVSPTGTATPMQIVDVSFPPRARVTYETVARDSPMHQQVWVLEGTIEVTVDGDVHRLGSGDCLALVLEGPVIYHNPTGVQARYAVVIASEPALRR